MLDNLSKDRLFDPLLEGRVLRTFGLDPSVLASAFYSNRQVLLRPTCGADVQSRGDCVIHGHQCVGVVDTSSLVETGLESIDYELLQSLWRDRHTQSSGG